MSRRKYLLGSSAAVLIGVVGTLLLRSGGLSVGVDAPASRRGSASVASVRDRPAPPPRVLPTRTVAEAAPGRDPVYAALVPGRTILRCPTDVLSPGRYDAVVPSVQLVEVSAGLLTAAVVGDEGRTDLRENFVSVARLDWQGDRCAVTPTRRTTITGIVRGADGQPVADHEVRGCLHGEFARTDADGRFTLAAVDGSECWPMAFVERTDGRFGRSAPVGVSVEADAPEVELRLPDDDDLWTEDDLRQQAGMLVGLFEQRIAGERTRLEALEAGAATLSGDEAEVAHRLLAHETGFVAHVEGEMERLEDPEEQLDALRDAWLSLN